MSPCGAGPGKVENLKRFEIIGSTSGFPPQIQEFYLIAFAVPSGYRRKTLL